MPQIAAGRFEDLAGEDDLPRVKTVRDVLVVPSPGHRASEQDWLDNPPVSDAVDLGNGVFVERLSADNVAEQVIEASVARGLNFEAVRQFGQLYSFWREVPAAEYEERLFAWDPAQAIAEAIALSRFVLDNAHCAEFAGRVIDRTDGHRRIASPLGLDGRLAYRVRKDRFWFTTDDAQQLRALLDQYRDVEDALPDRVRRALWHADRSAYCRYLTEAVANIVTGLEAMLNTGDDEPTTAQFTKRSHVLASELGVETSRSYWSWVYDVRSKAVHGAEAKLVVPAGWDETEGDPPPDVARVAQAQDVLRAAIRKAIEDPGFRSAFASDEAVGARWPL